ncbi:MAG: mismatch repair protein MutS domain protein [Gemmatimonadetes bacterium]|nr:mismatch repair protein MutS domain protein [Gemmatimonadota bacterium]
MSDLPVPYYTERAATADAAATLLELHTRRLSWARLASALAIVLLVYQGTHGLAPQLAWTAGMAMLVVFGLLVRAHRRTSTRAAHERHTSDACRAGIARCVRDWSNIPAARITRSSSGRAATATDLDILGDVSLFRLLDVSAPAMGGTRVLEWLLNDPANVATISSRQHSVTALRDRSAFLVESALRGRHASYARSSATSTALNAFVAWCGNSSGNERWTTRARVAMAVTMLFVLLAVWRPVATTPIAIALVAIQLFLATRARKQLASMLSGLNSLVPQLRGLDASMRLIAAEPDVPGEFGVIQTMLRRERAATALGALDSILRWNDVHLTPMMHFPLNAILGIDVHIAAALERWRTQSGTHMAEWVGYTSNAQALTSLATLAYENPAWTMPVVNDDVTAYAFHADGVTHPLLAPTLAVPNDVRIDTNGSLLALSGSNMAGKTTYLRAIGLNAALAFAGGPMSASQAAIRRARVRTSVRIQDDLGAGVSLFLAEVSRLRDVVRDSEHVDASPVLFLFDEILHGTNAADRRHASQVILRRLLTGRSWGVLTTHDADLVSDLFDDVHVAHSASVQQGHFRETVQRDASGVRMSFDYRLRPGPTTSANARVILEMIGLDRG